MSLRFVRRGDGMVYEFLRAPGGVGYQRVDASLLCHRLPDFGWCIVDSTGQVLSRPFDDAGRGERPPTGTWVSRKGDQSYVYDLYVQD